MDHDRNSPGHSGLGFAGQEVRCFLSTLLQPATLRLRQASGALDIVSLEYARALRGNVQSRAASRRALEQVGVELSAAAPLKQLYPENVARAAQALASASRAASRQAAQEIMEAPRRAGPLRLHRKQGRKPVTIGRASRPFPRSKPDVRLSPHPAFQTPGLVSAPLPLPLAGFAVCSGTSGQAREVPFCPRRPV